MGTIIIPWCGLEKVQFIYPSETERLCFYIWKAAAIVSSELASQMVTRLNWGSPPNCRDPITLTSLKQKSLQSAIRSQRRLCPPHPPP